MLVVVVNNTVMKLYRGSMVKHLRQRTPIRALVYPFNAWVSLPVANIRFSLRDRYALHYCMMTYFIFLQYI